MVEKHYDFVVVGTGACFREFIRFLKKENGKEYKVLIIDEQEIGGECLHKTCLPLAYLYETAKLLKGIKRGYYFGVVFDYVKFDYMMMKSQFMLYKNHLKEELKKTIDEMGFDLMHVSLQDLTIDEKNNKIILKNKEISYDTLILSQDPKYVFKHPIIKVDNHICFLAQEFINFNRDLERVLIYGSGSLSYSLSSLFGNLSGVEVFYVLSNDPFLHDLPISEELKRVAKRRLVEDLKINLIESDEITKYQREGNKAQITLRDYGLIEDIDLILVEGEKESSYLIEVNKENILKCGPSFYSGNKNTFYDFYKMKFLLEKRNHSEIENINFIFGIPSISYHLTDNYSQIKILKGESHPLKELYDLHIEDTIKIYLDKDDIVKGYEIVANNSEMFAHLLEIFINHKIPFKDEIFFNPNILTILRKLEG